ncbi:sorting nexin mvp1 [Lineolata rhizophorae]|uniref:Sorting nexin MVP1 n=1 Tax=Lineolata rhizophorae TaxID=578093 RepID=A0A6A6NNA7_9PEZI|nr:sorting nexin mvp1 [Lineolata rhizophorae]
MSLFGSSPPDASPLPATRTKSSLFDDEPNPAAKTSSSLFADDFDSGASSPWDFPTPKKAPRGNLVKTLLPADDVPESYIDAYDSLLAKGARLGGGASLEGVKSLLRDTGLSQGLQDKVLGIVVTDGSEQPNGIGRNEFNVLLALVGLAQEGEDVTLDGVDERRRNLPEPNLGSEPKPPAKVSSTSYSSQKPQATPSSRVQTNRKQSFGFPDSDPWNSPAAHQDHDHASTQATTTPQVNGAAGLNGSSFPPRTTSTFTTATEQGGSGEANGGGQRSGRPQTGGDGAGWGNYDNSPSDTFGGGFGDSSGGAGGGDNNDPTGLGRALGENARMSSVTAPDEVISVTSIPEKEGMFMFQHRNYQVTSARRNSKVIRRYSDFVWLLDCLQKRYPFRLLPLLPPKRVAINGNYLAADASFVEKRRRGLARFLNALVRHPILSQEQLVIMFLTVPTELAVWRKQASISVQEEFAGKLLPPGLEDSLPPTLGELFDTVRSGVRRSAEVYINLCTLVERLTKRKEGIAADNLRFATILGTLADATSATYAVDTNDVPLLNDGLQSTAKHLNAAHGLLEDEARAWDEGVLEDFKKMRDTLVGMRDLFDRRDRLARDNIPQLERRIKSNEGKLASIRARPESQQRPGEAEKIEEAIFKDKQSIVAQHARGVFIKECIRDELIFFQQTQYQLSRLHQDWSQECVKYAELHADNWRAMSEEVEAMPLGD